jgi:uncharacterized membrane protein YccF (DUF307 family)
MAAGWIIAAVFMAITIIGLPWTRAAFNIAAYTLLPFGQKAVSRTEYMDTQMWALDHLAFSACLAESGQGRRGRIGRT